MSAVTREALWQRLCDAGLAQGQTPSDDPQASPWYVRAMLGIAGWLGALFMLGFVGAALASLLKSGLPALLAGLLCCTVAWAIFRLAPRNDFAAQFGLAVSLAGQVMFVFGLDKGLGSHMSGSLFVTAVFEAVLAVLMANYVHRVWSVFAALLALGFALVTIGIHNLMPGIVAAGLAVVWMNEMRWARHAAFVQAIGYGFALALLQIDTMLFLGRSLRLGRSRPGDALLPEFVAWLGPLIAGAILVYVVYRLLERHALAPSSRGGAAALIAAVIVALVALKAPGIALALIVMLLGFSGGNRVLFGLGVIALLAFLSWFYYSLQLTLLAKSMVLAGTGAVLIGLWAAMRLLIPDRAGGGPERA